MRVYLAGAMEFTTDNGAGWRVKLANLLDKKGHTYFNPCTDEAETLGKHGYTDPQVFQRSKLTEEKRFNACMRDIAIEDLRQLKESDAVIVHLTPSLGGGTLGEVTAARYTYGVPVVGVWHPEATLAETSGWLYACCDIVFTTFEEAVAFISQ